MTGHMLHWPPMHLRSHHRSIMTNLSIYKISEASLVYSTRFYHFSVWQFMQLSTVKSYALFFAFSIYVLVSHPTMGMPNNRM